MINQEFRFQWSRFVLWITIIITGTLIATGAGLLTVTNGAGAIITLALTLLIIFGSFSQLPIKLTLTRALG